MSAPLVQGIPNTAITASSQYMPSSNFPWKSRKDSGDWWAPRSEGPKRGEWIQWEFRERVQIDSVLVQCASQNNGVQAYRLSYGSDPSRLVRYSKDISDVGVEHKAILSPPIRARYVRLELLQTTTNACMRAELFGQPLKSLDAVELPSRAHLLQRLLEADDKDVTFNLKDHAIEKAHSAVLAASSDVFKAMLRHDMQEKCGAIDLTDVTRSTMRVFLRLLYTGQVSEKDWCGHVDSDEIQIALIPEDAVAPPLDILLSVLSLAQKYMLHDIRSLVVQILKGRLCALNGSDEKGIQAFENIMTTAIKNDIGPLRMFGLEVAQSWCQLEEKYVAKQLRPEVQFELEAIWQTPSEGRVKIRRVV